MYPNYEMSDNIADLATALSQYQATAQNPANVAKNPFLKNKYAPLNSILSEVRPELARHGLAVTQLIHGNEANIGVTTLLTHASGQYISSSITLTPSEAKGVSTAQSAGIVITYLRRYAVLAILGLSGEDDTDGNFNHDSPRPQQRNTTPPAQPEKQLTDLTPREFWIAHWNCVKKIGFDSKDKTTEFAEFVSWVLDRNLSSVQDITTKDYDTLHDIFSDCNKAGKVLAGYKKVVTNKTDKHVAEWNALYETASKTLQSAGVDTSQLQKFILKIPNKPSIADVTLEDLQKVVEAGLLVAEKSASWRDYGLSLDKPVKAPDGA